MRSIRSGMIAVSEIERIATGRSGSLFQEDLDTRSTVLRERIRGSRVAVIGAAGSIGASVLKCVLRFRPDAVALIDASENNLVETVRDLRSTPGLELPEALEALPIALGSMECSRFFLESRPFDYILNLSAMKHVRSEKNIYCLIRMVDTNVLFPADLIGSLPYRVRNFFSVSSDKATAPANLMGASKMAMEKLLLARANTQPFSTARFANVAFSDGSLPHGFLKRIEKGQAISAPTDTRRFFMSQEEAGQICLLSCMLGESRDVFFPRLQTGSNERTFDVIARDLLWSLGYEPVECSSEEEAKGRVAELIPRKKWPCFFFRSDTTGEKEYEEFYSAEEEVDLDTYRNIGVIKQKSAAGEVPVVEEFIQFARRAKSDAKVTKADYVRAFQKIVSDLHHLETGRNLDQKM